MTFHLDKKSSKIGILLGGLGPEKGISVQSGSAIEKALNESGYNTLKIVVDENTPSTLAKQEIDVAVIALHGAYGEDGCIQGILEFLKIPYTGSGVLASALAMDKHLSKSFFQSQGIQTAKHVCLEEKDLRNLENRISSLGFPVFVKPRFGGSSVASGKAENLQQAYALCKAVFEVDTFALIETHISGREIAVGILNNKAIGSIEITPKGEFYDFKSKYEKGQSQYFIPARLDEQTLQLAYKQAETAHLTIGASSATRVDFLCTGTNELFMLEINTIPGFTPTSLLPKIAKAHGIDFPRLCEIMLEGASLKQSAATSADK